MINISLRQLRYCLTLADTLNFSRAAARSGIAQSTLSSAIQALEEELGAALFDRTARSVALTRMGESLLPEIRRILAAVDGLPQLVAEHARPLSRQMKFGIIPSIAPFILPRALPSLKAAFPDLRLSLHEGMTRVLLHELRSGELDIVMMALPFAHGEFEHKILGTDSLLLAVPRQSPLASRNTVSTDDLKGEQLLLLGDGHCLREHALAALGIPSHREPGDVRAASLATLVQMVDNNMGVTVLPRIAVETGITRGTSIVLHPLNDRPRASRHIALVWKGKSSRRDEFMLLADHLRQELASVIAVG